MGPTFKKIFSTEPGPEQSPGVPASSYAPNDSDVSADNSQWAAGHRSAPASPMVEVPYAQPRTTVPAKNVLNSDVSVNGSLKFTDDLLIDGLVEGDISSQGTLTIGENAQVTAEIKTSSVIIHGKLHGNIYVTDRVEMKSTAEVIGDVRAASIAIEAGAVFIGRSEVGGAIPPVAGGEKKASRKAEPATEPTAKKGGDSDEPVQQLLV